MTILLKDNKITINATKKEIIKIFKSNPKSHTSKEILNYIINVLMVNKNLHNVNYKALYARKTKRNVYIIIIKPYVEKLYCYKRKTLRQLNVLLQNDIISNSKHASLYHNDNIYYLLCTGKIPDNTRFSNKYIKNVLNEHAKLISKDVKKEIIPLL